MSSQKEEKKVVSIVGDLLTSRVVAWRRARNKRYDIEFMISKLGEEFGEVARAAVGDLEGRKGRGNVRQEAAQVVFLLMDLVDTHYSDDGVNLLDELVLELERKRAW